MYERIGPGVATHACSPAFRVRLWGRRVAPWMRKDKTAHRTAAHVFGVFDSLRLDTQSVVSTRLQGVCMLLWPIPAALWRAHTVLLLSTAHCLLLLLNRQPICQVGRRLGGLSTRVRLNPQIASQSWIGVLTPAALPYAEAPARPAYRSLGRPFASPYPCGRSQHCGAAGSCRGTPRTHYHGASTCALDATQPVPLPPLARLFRRAPVPALVGLSQQPHVHREARAVGLR
jgi:hypothetical protein